MFQSPQLSESTLSKLTILIPTLNEEVGLQAKLPKLVELGASQILIVDGGSTDRTLEIARAHGIEYLVQDPSKKGLRNACQLAFPHIRCAIVVVYSPDGNSPVEAIPRLVTEIERGFDLVIGSRYIGGAVSFDDTWLTQVGNFIFSRIISIFGFPFTDALIMFRAYRLSLIEELGILAPRSDFFERTIGRYSGQECLMSIRAAARKKRIAEIPVDEPVRIDQIGMAKLWLPASRVYHFRGGAACFCQVCEEVWTLVLSKLFPTRRRQSQ